MSSVTRKILIAHVGEIALGRTKHFRFGHAQGIAFNDGATIKAYVNRCTHMGGPVELANKGDAKIFRCRWHLAEFDPCTGHAIQGEAPAGSMLTPIKVFVEGENIYGELELHADPWE